MVNCEKCGREKTEMWNSNTPNEKKFGCWDCDREDLLGGYWESVDKSKSKKI